MAKLSEEAKEYNPPAQTRNIAELNEVPVDIDVYGDSFEAQDKDSHGNLKFNESGEPVMKTVNQKVFDKDDETYRVPNSVLKQLKVLLDDNPNLKRFKVKKSGQGLNTDYTVIPLMDNTSVPVEKPGQ